MPDKKDVASITIDLELKLSEVERICQALIETAKNYNEQKGQRIYDIDSLKNNPKKYGRVIDNILPHGHKTKPPKNDLIEKGYIITLKILRP